MLKRFLSLALAVLLTLSLCSCDFRSLFGGEQTSSDNDKDDPIVGDGYEIANSASYTINGTPNYAAFDTAKQRGMIFVATAPAVTTYTVTYDANGGTGSMADATGVSGDYVLLVCGFTAPNGKQFKAWSVGGVEKAVGSIINVTANTTVTAIWEAVEYNVRSISTFAINAANL